MANDLFAKSESQIEDIIYRQIKYKEKVTYRTRVYIILCKLIDEFSKFNALPFYLHKNFYTLYRTKKWEGGYF